ITLESVAISNCTYGVYVGNGVHHLFNAWNSGSSSVGPLQATFRSCLLVKNGTGYSYNDTQSFAHELFYNCTIADNDGDGIFRNRHGASHSYAYNTIVANNGGAGYMNVGVGGNDYMDSCCIYGNGDGNTVRPGGGSLIMDVASLAIDPSFIAGTYELGAMSQCLKAGLDLSYANVFMDVTGAEWEGVYDMGCYKSALAAPTFLEEVWVDGTLGSDGNDGSEEYPKETIGGGMRILAKGGTLHVAAGTYTEAASLPAGAQLLGAGVGQTILDGGVLGDTVVLLRSDSTLRGVDIVGGGIGLQLQGSGNGVSNCAIYASGQSGIQVQGGMNLVTHSLVDGAATCGIEDIGLGGNVIERTEVRNVSGGHGIYFSAVPARNVDVRSCIVSNNALATVNGYGIYVQPSSNVATIPLIENSLIAGNLNGIFIGGSTAVGLSRSTAVNYCTVAGNVGEGLTFVQMYSIPHAVYNTIVAGNAKGIVRTDPYGVGTTSLGGVVVSDNAESDFVWYRNGIGFLQNLTFPIHAVGAKLGADYVPTTGSWAIGAAISTAVPMPELDLAGTPRPTESPADIGCFHTGLTAPTITPLIDAYVDPVLGNDDNSGAQDYPKKTIAAALAVTDDGGTCHVPAGDYDNVTLFLPGNVTLQGAGAGETTLRGTVGAGQVAIITPPWVTECTIADLAIEDYTMGLICEAATQTLSRVTIEAMDRYGIFFLKPKVLLADQTTITRCALSGIYASYANNTPDGVLSLSRCTVTENGQSGLFLSDSAFVPRIENCLIADNAQYGIFFRLTYPAPVASNGVTRVIRHNTVTGNGMDGIRMSGHLSHGGLDWFFHVENNLIVGNANNGLVMATGNGTYDVNLARNLYFGNGAGIEEEEPTEHQRVVEDDGARVHEDEEYPDLFDDPLPLNADYVPSARSPAVNAARPSDLMTDYYGNGRLGKPDIGAVECQVSASTLIIVR
ncbi:MAG: right-handed parallel beta-helix repeat-containing protein, partial [Kiritimatiellaeota bacterium]|nr:right-handed parallel beta-helix repeat-containing protein [Kiritimatiellota bacterium]